MVPAMPPPPPSIDRIAPGRRPDAPAAGSQRWRQLTFMHWPVPVAALRGVLPAGLTVDTFDDVAWIGVVPFAMEAVRPRGLPALMAFDFLETNVRTYVIGGGEPGVYFLSLEAASRLAVAAARATFGLPYWYARMSMARTGDVIRYASTRRTGGATHRSEIQVGAELGPAAPGTFEHFLVERYLLFVERRGALMRAQVHHTPYPLRRAVALACDDGLIAAAGLPAPTDLPAHVCFSDGVDVEVFAPRPV